MSTSKKPSWLYRLFNDLYEVTLYFDLDTESPSSEKYMLKEIHKLNQNYMKGVDNNGHKIEFKSTKPFDYKIKKIY